MFVGGSGKWFAGSESTSELKRALTTICPYRKRNKEKINAYLKAKAKKDYTTDDETLSKIVTAKTSKCMKGQCCKDCIAREIIKAAKKSKLSERDQADLLGILYIQAVNFSYQFTGKRT